MKEKPNLLAPLQSSNDLIFKENISWRMLIAGIICCLVGIVWMAATAYYLPMAAFSAVLITMGVTFFLYMAGKISLEAANLVPMLLLCFVYTPISWFTFDGLLGSTPYLTILFATLIILTNYQQPLVPLLSLYSALVAGLNIHWVVTHWGAFSPILVANILMAYVITTLVIAILLFKVKNTNSEISSKMIAHSMHDELTGLYNRRAIEQVLDLNEKKYAIDQTDFIVIMFDIDQFKSINDQYGHILGDSAVISFAERLQKVIRSRDFAIRFGGDEFLVFLAEVRPEAVQSLISRIENAVREIPGFAFPITASMGYALRSECTSIDQVIPLADQRMYAVKKSKLGGA